MPTSQLLMMLISDSLRLLQRLCEQTSELDVDRRIKKSQQDLCLCECDRLAAGVQIFFMFFQNLFMIIDSDINIIMWICVCRAVHRNKSDRHAGFSFPRKSEKHKQTRYLCMPSDVAPLLPVLPSLLRSRPPLPPPNPPPRLQRRPLCLFILHF